MGKKIQRARENTQCDRANNRVYSVLTKKSLRKLFAALFFNSTKISDVAVQHPDTHVALGLLKFFMVGFRHHSTCLRSVFRRQGCHPSEVDLSDALVDEQENNCSIQDSKSFRKPVEKIWDWCESRLGCTGLE